jgi:hypothetical protein
MPYIGKAPVGGGFHKLDNLTASATDTYALTLGSAAYYPETANQLLVSLNGVIQACQDSFTVSGSNLVFASALTSSDSIDFIVALGDVLGVGGVTDGTVTTAKIANNAVTMDKLATSGTLPALDGSNLTGLSGSNVKEQLVMLCDGEDYTVSSGTYTAANVTVKQDMTTTYADITGSSISYTPPSGTVCVLYEFIFAYVFIDDHAISHFRLYIDSDEVTDQRQTISCQSRPQWQQSLRYIIPIGGTGSTSTGRQSTWTTAKTLKIQGRDYGASNDAELHTAEHWDGTSFTGVIKPKLLITALG